MRKLDKKQQEAVDIVNQAISDYRTTLEALTLCDSGDLDPIMIEGETEARYHCQLMVNPKEVATILLNYDFPLYEILGEEAPQAMWDDLGDHFGLGTVTSFDL